MTLQHLVVGTSNGTDTTRIHHRGGAYDGLFTAEPPNLTDSTAQAAAFRYLVVTSAFSVHSRTGGRHESATFASSIAIIITPCCRSFRCYCRPFVLGALVVVDTSDNVSTGYYPADQCAHAMIGCNVTSHPNDRLSSTAFRAR